MPPSDSSAWVPRWLRANGLDFGVLCRGEQGPRVVCLHGFPDTAWSFVDLLERLAAAGFRAVAPFMRGYAPTSIPADGDYRVLTLGRDVIALIEALGDEPAFVVGHDWGAVAAYAAATQRPDRVRAVVTAAVPHLRRFVLQPTLRQLRRSRYMGLFQLRGLSDRIVRRDGAAYVDALVREWSPGWDYDPGAFAAVKALLRDDARRAALLGYYRAMPRSLLARDGWRTLLRPLPVPACVIRGARDGCIGPEMFAGQERCFGAGLEQVELAAGHFMHLEQPEAFAAATIDFLRRHA